MQNHWSNKKGELEMRETEDQGLLEATDGVLVRSRKDLDGEGQGPGREDSCSVSGTK